MLSPNNLNTANLKRNKYNKERSEIKIIIVKVLIPGCLTNIYADYSFWDICESIGEHISHITNTKDELLEIRIITIEWC